MCFRSKLNSKFLASVSHSLTICFYDVDIYQETWRLQLINCLWQIVGHISAIKIVIVKNCYFIHQQKI